MNKNNLLMLCLVGIVLVTNIACEHVPASTIIHSSKMENIHASGELESAVTAKIGPPAISRMWQYKIKHLAAENSQVKKGDVIAAFDSQSISERLFDKQSELNTATKEFENKQRKEIATKQGLILAVAEKQMEFDKAQRKYEIIDNSRSENDRKKAGIDFTIAQSDLFLAQKKLKFHNDNSLLNIKLAQSKIDRLTSEVKEFNKNIKQLTLTAPIDGMVLYKENWNGEKPIVGATINFGQPILEISVIERMQLKAQIAEPDSGKITIGMPVKISLDGNQELVFPGQIASLGRVFRDKSQQDKKRIIDAIITFNATDLTILRPGMTARIEMTVKPNTTLLSKKNLSEKSSIKQGETL